MISYAFHLQKGGISKTTLSGTVAWSLAKHGKTCLVDVDPQGNSSSWYMGEELTADHELADALFGRVEIKDALLEVRENFFLLPTFGLDGELKLYGENQLANEPFVFDDLNEELQKLGFDYVIYDLSPGMSRLEKAVLISVNEVITPMTPEYFSLDGIEIFSNEIKKLQKNMRRTIKHDKIVVSAFNKSIDQHKDVMTKIPQGAFKVFTVPVEPAFRKAQSLAKSIFELSAKERPKKETTEVINSLVEALK